MGASRASGTGHQLWAPACTHLGRTTLPLSLQMAGGTHTLATSSSGSE